MWVSSDETYSTSCTWSRLVDEARRRRGQEICHHCRERHFSQPNIFRIFFSSHSLILLAVGQELTQNQLCGLKCNYTFLLLVVTRKVAGQKPAYLGGADWDDCACRPGKEHIGWGNDAKSQRCHGFEPFWDIFLIFGEVEKRKKEWQCEAVGVH